MNVDLTIPGLLFIDTPGHEAFTTLRKRGGAIADLAVLVIDINEGVQPQTRESINFLKQFKTPFVVALTKVDRLIGWIPQDGSSFLKSISEQPERSREEFEKGFYKVVGQLGQEGFSSERYDRIEDYSKQVALVPLSGLSGEGIPDLLVVIAGLAQKFLRRELEVHPGEGKGTVLEVKEYPGLGTTIDVILYDGKVRRGDYLVVGGKDIVQSRIKALLEPAPLKELRIEKGFSPVQEVSAAAGVKISGPGLEGVIAGSPLRTVKDSKSLPKAVEEVREEVEEVEFESSKEGALLRTDTLGSLEALIKSLRDIVPIRSASVGSVSRQDVMEARTMENPVIFAFGVKVSPETESMAKDNKVALFHSQIIYHMIESYQEWIRREGEREEDALLEGVARPALLRVLPGCLFRQKSPAVFGVEVAKGILKQGSELLNGNKRLGPVKEVQDRGESLKQAEAGSKIAISMPEAVFGKDLKEGDELLVFIPEKDRETLGKLRKRLRGDELELLEGE